MNDTGFRCRNKFNISQQNKSNISQQKGRRHQRSMATCIVKRATNNDTTTIMPQVTANTERTCAPRTPKLARQRTGKAIRYLTPGMALRVSGTASHTVAHDQRGQAVVHQDTRTDSHTQTGTRTQTHRHTQTDTRRERDAPTDTQIDRRAHTHTDRQTECTVNYKAQPRSSLPRRVAVARSMAGAMW